MTKPFVDHFAAVSADYAGFRPTYPSELFDWLADIAPARTLVWDCATGTGQAARALAMRFERVVATDASASQIAAAAPHDRVDYRVAPAEHSGLADGSVDLVTVATALHWFDIPSFFAEARRVLARDGVLAVWVYGRIFAEDEHVNAVVQRFYADVVGPYWPPERALVDSGYETIEFPFELIVPPTSMPGALTVSWTLPELLGYVGTWSSAAHYREQTGTDPVEWARDELASVWGPAESRHTICWPLTVHAGRFDVPSGIAQAGRDSGHSGGPA